MIQTYDAIFYQIRLQKDSNLMKMILEKQKTKKILMAIQMDRLFEQKMSLITKKNYPMLFGKRAKKRISKL